MQGAGCVYRVSAVITFTYSICRVRHECSVTHVHIACQQTLHLHIKCVGCGKIKCVGCGNTFYKFAQGLRFLFYLFVHRIISANIHIHSYTFIYILSVYAQPIAFGVSFLESRFLIDNLKLYVSCTTFRWKETKEIEVRDWDEMCRVWEDQMCRVWRMRKEIEMKCDPKYNRV